MSEQKIDERERFIRAVKRMEKALDDACASAVALDWVGFVGKLQGVRTLVNHVKHMIPPKS